MSITDQRSRVASLRADLEARFASWLSRPDLPMDVPLWNFDTWAEVKREYAVEWKRLRQMELAEAYGDRAATPVAEATP